MRARAMVMAVIAALCCAAAGGSALAEWPPPTSNISLEGVRADFDGEAGCFAARSVQIHWEWTYANDGYPPYAMTIAGWAVDAEAESVSYSCWRILWLLDGPLLLGSARLEHGIAYLPMRVIDSVGGEATAEVAIPVAPPPPAAVPEDLVIVAGISELFVVPSAEPYGTWRKAGWLREITLGRYRLVGAAEWSYFALTGGFPQNSSGSLPRHVSDLEANALYELQLAYVWYGSYGGRHGEHPERWTWWNDPAEVRWSETREFRTHGAEAVTAESTSDSLTVMWHWSGKRGAPYSPPWLGKYRVTVRSDAWPGVVWGISAGYLPENWRAGGVFDDLEFSSTIRGLPSDTDYSVSVARVPPWGFETPPETLITVRTTGDDNGGFGAADPGGMTVGMRAGSLVVSWTCAEGAVDRITLVGEERRRFSSWDQCPPDEVVPPENRGIKADFGALEPDVTYRLYFTRFPHYGPHYGPGTPYMCIIRDIRVPPVERSTLLDLVLRRVLSLRRVEIAPVPIPPFERYIYNYGECWLRPDAAP